MIDLHESGIHTEKSDYRIHVDLNNKVVVAFKREESLFLLPEPIHVTNDDQWEINGYKLIYLYGKDRPPTARGIRIDVREIPLCHISHIPPDLREKIDNYYRNRKSSDNKKKQTVTKKTQAEWIAKLMMKRGLCICDCSWLIKEINPVQVDNRDEQICGIDFKADRFSIQVKHDHHCFTRVTRGGGLFFQTHEKNTYGWH